MRAIVSVLIGFLFAIVVWRSFVDDLRPLWLTVSTTFAFLIVGGLAYLLTNDLALFASIARALIGIL